jgi:hypothetical protein
MAAGGQAFRGAGGASAVGELAMQRLMMPRVPTPRALPSLSLRWCWYRWVMRLLERGKRRRAFRVRSPLAHTGDGNDDDDAGTKRCWLCWCCASGR